MIPIDYDAEDIPELLGYPGLMARWMSSEMGITERERGWRILRYLARNYLMEDMVIDGTNTPVHWASLHTDIFDLNIGEVLNIEHNEEQNTLYIMFNEESLTEDQRLLWIDNDFTLELIWFIANHSGKQNVRDSFSILLDYFRVFMHRMRKHAGDVYGGTIEYSEIVTPHERLRNRTTIELAELLAGG